MIEPPPRLNARGYRVAWLLAIASWALLVAAYVKCR